ncbi:hypothetical protein OKA04_00340 [Luteolibacter flavescens]|uniref:Uncharacterized protein n=1 Tax=Luteolibacter flavescens TaxID=1859460 RepID=A0ABT3FHX6_9BACT|nr:hypothetical protein [Luteolibacter flavescens]MCW1883155.1 hypothetical protein [Luteolibacter flavescens]
MQPFRLILPLVLAVAACGPVSLPGTATAAPAVAATNLTAAQKAAIGRKIWQNECGGTVAGLTTWNAGEEFPSLGIGHFIWYPAGFNGRFEESWPQFVAFARQQGATPPAVALQRHSPWKTKAEFRGPQLDQLRQWLANNVPVQTDFIIARSRGALPKILAAAPASDRARLQANYNKVASTANGTYALIDYVNFKGDGTQPSERYNDKGWGLLQVLGSMKDVPAGQPAAAEFSASAKRMLSRRIDNAPPARGEGRWKEGWLNRCSTYARPL